MRAILALVAAVFLFGLPAGAAPWPTKKFDIYKGDPGFFSRDDEDELPQQSELNKLENFLEYAANRLEAWGFPAPNLELVSTDTCRRCYRIYLDEIPTQNIFSTDTLGATSDIGWTYANGDKTVIQLERRLLVLEDEFTLDASAYFVAAHELFHAIQYNTPHWRDAEADASGLPINLTNRTGKWIGEGTSDAIALYLYETYPLRSTLEAIVESRKQQIIDLKKLDKKQLKAAKDQIRFDAQKRDWRILGVRTYNEPLPIKADASGRLKDYYTSSFWRYLAEVYAARKQWTGDYQPAPTREDADFSYLADFFARDYVDNSETVETAWLDSFLKEDDQFGQPLGQTYAEFVTSLANYWQDRNKDAHIRWEAWMAMYFQKSCPVVSFPPGRPSLSLKFEISELSSNCILLKQDRGYEPLAIDIQIETASAADIEALWIGIPEEHRVSRRAVVEPDTARNKSLGIWRNYIVSPDGSTLVIIANAVDSKPIKGLLRVTMNKRDQHTQNVPAADPSGDPVEGKTALAMRMEAAGTETSLSGQFAMQMQESDTFLDIRLGSSPVILDSMAGLHGSGGFVDQLLVSASALKNMMPTINGALAANAGTLNTVPGAEVFIRIPRIEYGFTGTVEGARIRYSGGTGPDLYAIGPQDSDPGPQQVFDPSSIVTITEYSPEVLVGSYRANLVDPELAPAQKQQARPVLRTVSTVEEQFAISAPWVQLSDTATAMPVDPWGELESGLMKRMPQDLKGAGRDIAAEARRVSEEDREPDFSSIKSGLSAPSGTCDCSCAGLDALNRMGEAVDAAGRAPTAAERQLAMCAMTCSAQYAMCEGD